MHYLTCQDLASIRILERSTIEEAEECSAKEGNCDDEPFREDGATNYKNDEALIESAAKHVAAAKVMIELVHAKMLKAQLDVAKHIPHEE